MFGLAAAEQFVRELDEPAPTSAWPNLLPKRHQEATFSHRWRSIFEILPSFGPSFFAFQVGSVIFIKMFIADIRYDASCFLSMLLLDDGETELEMFDKSENCLVNFR